MRTDLPSPNCDLRRRTAPALLAFTGQATAGKTTAALHVVAVGDNFHRLSFADPIRQMLLALGLNAEDLSTRKHEPHPLLCGKSPRAAMQSLGTGWGRDAIGPELWLRAMEKRFFDVWSAGGRIVIDDLRFDNEAHLVHRFGGIVVALDRPGLPPRMAHVSERGIAPDLIDRRLCCDGESALRRAVGSLVLPLQ